MKEMQVVISKDKIRFVYSDDLLGLTQQGKPTIKRASHVEPHEEGWKADLRPVNGPVLGPFQKRSEALAEEVKWLKENRVPVPEK